ncbi:hypothetical protein CDD80_1070 [Ophiocordyceps camponoti-rufipedis]|uniref:Smr domain-containing protein n=1 Tax=Ophiocordyceps camponoti-rufipedis TaxID=2004952 RepID=A0A2C5YR27_9HYPO|nr:hypothetical protein CDD80_1070 [Ophiocordyceps camponoti-rufipedis]
MADSSLVAKLVDSFHSLLDEALIAAIASDYDLTDPAAFDAAHSLLQRLARNVPSEEATGFNPSGIPIIADETGAGSTASASLSRPTSQTVATDLSSAETASSAAGEPVVTVIPRITSYDDDSDESKTRLLRSMFTELKVYDVEYSLKKAKGDFQSALDDLLDIQYLQSTGQQLKGIDGFFDDGNAAVSSKKKRKKKKTDKKQRETAEPDTSPWSHNESVVFEDGAQDEIGYIAERLGIRPDEVSDIYNKSQRSGGATVVELLDQYISHGVESQDDAGRQQADSLMRKYRHVPDKYLLTIVQVAGSISQFADDLAALLNKHFARQHKKKGEKLDLDYRITPLPRGDIEGGGWTTIKPKTPSTQTKPGTLGQAGQPALDHRQAKRDATATAARLHRSGAANSLYRQAACVYAEQAREQGRQAQQAASAAADLMVAERSTESSIDLHGVTVQDGVRIALQRTQDWWDGLGEYRARKAREHGFTVITGLGRHCAGGVSRLRQAVAAALLQERWKLQVLTGMFVVTGRQ